MAEPSQRGQVGVVVVPVGWIAPDGWTQVYADATAEIYQRTGSGS